MRNPRSRLTTPAATAVAGCLLVSLSPAGMAGMAGMAGAQAPHRTLGQSACSDCHEPQNRWWFKDPHFATADPLLAGDPRYAKVARLYGMSPAVMARGDRICAVCHATVLSGRETEEVRDGVSCESCHGAAEAWLGPHKEGDRPLGDRRPGYLAALDRGLRELRDLEVLAGVCVDCHNMVDVRGDRGAAARLVSAGHPPSIGFDLVRGMDRVRHWQRPLPPAATLEAAFQAERLARGRVTGVAAPRIVQAVRSSDPPSRATIRGGGRQIRGRPPAARPTGSVRPRAEERRLDLPPFPTLDDTTPIDQRLHALKARLELLYRTASEDR